MPKLIVPRAPRNVAAIVALAMLTAALALAGGASRADQFGQPIVRGAGLLAMAIVIGARLPLALARVRPILIVLGCAALLCAVQLLPLPPTLWYGFGGRADFSALARIADLPEIWRPLSLTPDATLNALLSLIVPTAVAIVIAALTADQLRMLLPGLVGFIAFGAVMGFVQLGSAGWTNPMLNETLGEAAGMFANRNHQALFLAIGLLLLPPWAMRSDWRLHWMRTTTAVVLIPFFILMILATGSRAGLVLAAVALLLDIWISADIIGAFFKRSKASLFAFVGGCLVLLVGLLLIASRTRTLDRLFATDAVEDFRFRAFPTVKTLVGTYFPWGSGLGSFDTVFRAAEPLALLKPTYFNHAHNDFAEIGLEAGLLGVALIVAGVGWIVVRAAAAHRSTDPRWRRHARAGAGIVVLMIVASAVDYPVRVPIHMALLVIAASWLQAAILPTTSTPTRG